MSSNLLILLTFSPFLVTFPAKHVVLGILDIYVSTASDENEDQVFIDPELTFRFAFNFPGKISLHPNLQS